MDIDDDLFVDDSDMHRLWNSPVGLTFRAVIADLIDEIAELREQVRKLSAAMTAEGVTV